MRIGIRLRILVGRGWGWGCKINSKARKEASKGGRRGRSDRRGRRGRIGVNRKYRGRGNRCRCR